MTTNQEFWLWMSGFLLGNGMGIAIAAGLAVWQSRRR